jgi:hypothetical protein
MIRLKMKRRSNQGNSCFLLIFSLLWGFIFLGNTTSLAQIDPRCLTPQYDAMLKSKHPSLHLHKDKLNELIAEAQRKSINTAHLRSSATEATIIIPVVVHVVHNTKSGVIGGANNANISDAQIQSQIDVLNEDYRRKEGSKGFNSNPVSADVNIEFHLATLDPNGNPTNGITRTYTDQTAFDINSDDEKLKAISYWPTNRYMNIWVTTLKNKYLGYAQFPDVNNVPGLARIGGLEKTDGVVINHTNFGRRTGTVVSNVYGDGRTTTHEVAHWLGLLHTWGDVDCGDDFCEDTPAATGPNNTVTCNEMFSSCTGNESRNMIENFLDYSPDLCMNVFTQNQKERILRVLEVSPRRAELVMRSGEAFRSAPTGDLIIGPNPTKNFAKITVNYKDLSGLKLEVINVMGALMASATYTTSGNTIMLDMRSVPNGLYFIRVSVGQETQTVKLLVGKES